MDISILLKSHTTLEIIAKTCALGSKWWYEILFYQRNPKEITLGSQKRLNEPWEPNSIFILLLNWEAKAENFFQIKNRAIIDNRLLEWVIHRDNPLFELIFRFNESLKEGGLKGKRNATIFLTRYVGLVLKDKVHFTLIYSSMIEKFRTSFVYIFNTLLRKEGISNQIC